MNNILKWIEAQFGVDADTVFEALLMSPSAQGYIHGAVSEIMLSRYLSDLGFNVYRIKEKPSGGFDEKKIGYKGDFLINEPNTDEYYVVECKGLKTNSEFRSGDTDTINHTKIVTKEQAYKLLKKYINPDKDKIYESGLKRYNKVKVKWEKDHPGLSFPAFEWNHEYPGADNADLTDYFKDLDDLYTFVENANPQSLTEKFFRERMGLYLILQTHQPSTRVDEQTGIDQAAPIKTDFSIMAVDLFQRTGKHEFVFMNPKDISHSPSSPNHLYQNYIIDIIIPGVKDDLIISPPWYWSINECISSTNPTKVEYDESQLDYR